MGVILLAFAGAFLYFQLLEKGQAPPMGSGGGKEGRGKHSRVPTAAPPAELGTEGSGRQGKAQEVARPSMEVAASFLFGGENGPGKK